MWKRRVSVMKMNELRWEHNFNRSDLTEGSYASQERTLNTRTMTSKTTQPKNMYLCDLKTTKYNLNSETVQISSEYN